MCRGFYIFGRGHSLNCRDANRNASGGDVGVFVGGRRGGLPLQRVLEAGGMPAPFQDIGVSSGLGRLKWFG